MKILITGFAPFGGQPINPSWEVVSRLVDIPFQAEIVTVCLPVEWEGGRDMLLSLLHKHKPDSVLLFGQAGGREGISIERVGINLCSSKAPDNAGIIRIDTPIVSCAPDAYAATLPVEELYSALQSAQISVHYSYDAGRYICNLVLWSVLHWAKENPGTQAGFVHLPFLPDQKENAPAMELSQQLTAAKILVETLIRHAEQAANIT